MSENTVFISYRRTSQYTALSVFRVLREHGYDVFFDYESIDTGGFEEIILRQIAARAHFVLILTPGALDRCVDPQDMVRKEIEEAIRLKRNIIPLLFEGFDIGKVPAHLLPGRMAVLPSYNSLAIPRELIYFDRAMEVLRERFLSQSLDGIIHPTPAADLPTIQHKMTPPRHEPLTVQQYRERGRKRLLRRDFEGAIADYTEVLRADPHDLSTYVERGIVRSASGDFQGAIADYTEVLRFDNGYAMAYYHRANAYVSSGNPEAAIHDYERYLELNRYLRPSDQTEIERKIENLKKKL